MYRGLRRGIYPALNMLMVFFLPLLITLNYYGELFRVVAWVAPESSLAVRETISFIGTYMITFTVFVYFVLWLCSESLKVHKSVDMVGGAILGAASGIVCCGVMIMFWFAMPFAEAQWPVDEGTMFFPCHKISMRAATFVAGKIPGERRFHGDRFIRDVRYGLPTIPSLGAGFYVSSIPNGLRVFVDTSGMSTLEFVDKMKERMAHPEQEISPSEARQPFAERRRSPVYVEGESKTALVGVVMDNLPRELRREMTDAARLFAHDGETFFSKESISDRALFVKVYRVERESGIAPIIALFHPRENPEMVEQFLPSRVCYKFEDHAMIADLRAKGGVSEEEAKRMLPQLHLGGKAWFLGFLGKPYTVMVTGENVWRIAQVIEPNPEALKGEPSATYR